MCAVCTHPWVQFSCIHRLHSGNYKTALQPSFSSHSLVIPHPKIPCIITLEHFAKIYLASTFHFGNWAHSVWNVAALCVCVCVQKLLRPMCWGHHPTVYTRPSPTELGGRSECAVQEPFTASFHTFIVFYMIAGGATDSHADAADAHCTHSTKIEQNKKNSGLKMLN